MVYRLAVESPVHGPQRNNRWSHCTNRTELWCGPACDDEGEGTVVCGSREYADVYNRFGGNATSETCDSQDNDCDGLTDETVRLDSDDNSDAQLR